MKRESANRDEPCAYYQIVRNRQQAVFNKDVKESYQASKRRWYRFVSWSICIDRVQRHFDAVAQECRVSNWMEHLYVSRLDVQRTIQLFFGRHPVTGFPVDKDNGMIVEHGATLVVSQGPKGDVIVLMYPFESKKGHLKKPRIIWNHFSSPTELADHVLVEMLQDFLTYARSSSLMMAESPADFKRLEFLENRSRAIEGSSRFFALRNSAFVALICGSTLTAALYLFWAWTGKQDVEPWAGLATLITGWFVYLFQRTTTALEKALIKEESENQDREQERRQDMERAKIAKDSKLSLMP